MFESVGFKVSLFVNRWQVSMSLTYEKNCIRNFEKAVKNSTLKKYFNIKQIKND